jgi:hypothetical protein
MCVDGRAAPVTVDDRDDLTRLNLRPRLHEQPRTAIDRRYAHGAWRNRDQEETSEVV